MNDATFNNAVRAESARGIGILEQLEVKQWIASLIEKLSSHKELQDVVAAAESIDGRYNSNQQIAETLGTTTTDVANRKKRILRIVFGVTK